jgi:hypothetical protein
MPRQPVETKILTKDDDCFALVQARRNELIQFIKKNSLSLSLSLSDNNYLVEVIALIKQNPQDKDAAFLTALEDLNKLNQLQKISIGKDPYYTLAESAGGVTEKVCLIDEGTLLEKLKIPINLETLSVNDYQDARQAFKLSTNAIIKLPKYKFPTGGDITEVQRESMALDMSRILGLTTTKSTLLDYQGKPAVFVPFDTIQLLSEVATGKTMHAALSSKTYSHYSTLNPVGEGLQANPIIDDLGKSIGLFYLCSDTDAIGGYNQNKALKGNSLFVFDQVFSLDDKLGLDSRLSMQPTKWFTKHTRHDQGRNRTVIEDSSIDTKFAALTQLKEKRTELQRYCNGIISGHRETLKKQRDEKALKSDIKATRKLLNDAIKVSKKVTSRLDKIDDVFPKIKGDKKTFEALLKPTLMLEKLCNKPVLFSNDGRPFRNPWTQRNALRATSISTDANPDYVRVRFNKSVPLDVLELLRKKTGHNDSPTRSWFKTVRILKSDLEALKENTFFPELRLEFDPEVKTTDYLDLDDLTIIKQGYGAGGRGDVINTVKAFNDLYSKKPLDSSKLVLIEAMEKELKSKTDNLADKGFGQHVLKKFHLDAQQKLQKLMPIEEKPDNINEAFKAALTLDQVSGFNRVVNCAIGKEKLQDPVFLKFLDKCIEHAASVTDHSSAKANSQVIQSLATETITQLKTVDLHIVGQFKERIQSGKECSKRLENFDTMDPSAISLEK